MSDTTDTTDATGATSTRPPLTVTLGGGGAYALGFHLGIADGLRDEGIDISRSPLMGTSGGSHAAVAIATGMTYDQIAAIWQPYVDGVKGIWVEARPLAEQLYAAAHIPEGSSAAGVAVRLRSLHREVLWASEFGNADVVAASSSPFPFVRPTKVGKRRYIDGGHRSGTSCDLAPDADLQLVLAPFAFKQQGFVGRLGARQIAKEPPKWVARTGGATLVVTPDEATMAIKCKGMKAMGDTTIGRSVYDQTRPLGRQLAGRLRAEHPDVLARMGIS
jgi:NTE family protein